MTAVKTWERNEYKDKKKGIGKKTKKKIEDRDEEREQKKISRNQMSKYLMHMSKKDLDLKDENEEKNNKANIFWWHWKLFWQLIFYSFWNWEKEKLTEE